MEEDNGTESDSGTSADTGEESVLHSPLSTLPTIPEPKTTPDAAIPKYPEIGNEKLEKRKQDVPTTTSSMPPRGDVFEQPNPSADTNRADGHIRGRAAAFRIPQENIPQFQPNAVNMPEIRHICKIPSNYLLPAPPLPVPDSILPCMRGTFREDVENRRHFCSGIWGMSMADTDHGITVRRFFLPLT